MVPFFITRLCNEKKKKIIVNSFVFCSGETRWSCFRSFSSHIELKHYNIVSAYKSAIEPIEYIDWLISISMIFMSRREALWVAVGLNAKFLIKSLKAIHKLSQFNYVLCNIFILRTGRGSTAA